MNVKENASLNQEMLTRDVLKTLLNNPTVFYIVVKTKFTTHHIERLMPTCKDRGRIKWIAETNMDAFENMEFNDEEARKSHVDHNDLFPRLYFLSDSFINEFYCWLRERNLTVIDIKAPRI